MMSIPLVALAGILVGYAVLRRWALFTFALILTVTFVGLWVDNFIGTH
jgi:hypothetical protein